MSRANSTKITFVGSSKVGKTAIIDRLAGKKVSNNYIETVGAAFSSITVRHFGTDYDILIWDTAGKEIYVGLLPLYIRESALIVLVYDVTSSEKFDEYLDRWTQIIEGEHSFDFSNGLIICNKIDQDNWTSSQEEISRICADMNFHVFFVSAMLKTHLNDVFQCIQEMLLDHHMIIPPPGEMLYE